jgi:hypothetical protein
VASVVQQLSLSFGVALASAIAALLLGDAPAPGALATALRRAFVALGALTAASSATFALLHPDDGRAVALPEEEPRRAA